MAFILVGGQAKSVGKTTLICNIVAAFPRLRWDAVKITDHWHDAAGCKLRTESVSWSIWEQVSIATESDTSRFIHSGAERAWLVRAEDRALEEAYAALRKMLSSDNVILESNRLSRFLDPDLFLLIVDGGQLEFKPSAQELLERVDAIVWRGSHATLTGDLARILNNKTSFEARKTDLDPKLASLIGNVIGKNQAARSDCITDET